MQSTEQLRPEQLVGLVARSAEGTAAKGMPIKGHEDLWVEIQANTFRNWVNEHLKHAADVSGGPVLDLAEDFRDGTRLCALVEVLTKRRLPRWNPRPANQHHHLENVSTALQAIEADGVKLVNIGNVDIVNGNLKLILGLIWSLIVRYQIGKSKFPPKKLMLAWLKAVLPECRVNNFTTDWNSGIYLSALLDYCKPGLFPHWRQLDQDDNVYNCQKAMEISKREFDIPMVLEPEYLASPYLDELSGMTYLSYFMKEGSPGFHATLRWVNSRLPQAPIRNFRTDWNDGRALCGIVRNLGGPAPPYEKLHTDPSAWEHNLQMGIDGGKKLGVEPILKAKDMADQNVEHLGVMAYAAYFQWVKPRPQASEQIAVHVDSTSARVQQAAHFKLEMLTKEVNTREVRGEVISPSGRVECRLTWNGVHGKGTFVPTEVGMHKLMVYNDGELLNGCPYYFRVLPALTKIKSPGMDPCAIGSIVEVLVNSYGTSHDGIDVTAWSPTERPLACPVKKNDGVHTATFQPDETGEWSIAITHNGNHIQGGPFTCFVFDPNGIKLLDTDGAMPGQPFSFIVDARGTGGLGDVIIDIVHDKQSISYRMEDIGHMQYHVSFVPSDAGKYRVYVYFNGSDVRGSPFSIRVGTQKGSRRSKESTSSLERSKVSSLERRMNGLNISTTPTRGSPVQKTYSTSTYKSASPTQNVSDYSPVQQHSSTYKSSNNYTSETSTYHKTSSLNHSRSPNLNQSPVSRSVHSPSIIKETKETYSSTTYNSSKSPGTQTPSLIKESKDIYASSTLTRSRSPNPSPASPGSQNSPTIKESRDIYQTGSLNRSRSPNRSPMFRSATQSPVNRSFSPRISDKETSYNGKSFTDNSVVDTSSNVRVSSMVGGTSRRDSWDAIAKTKSLLSYGSLESLANLANSSPISEHKTSTQDLTSNDYKNSHQVYSTKNATQNITNTEKFTTEIQSNRTQTHGILKNKTNDYYKNVDTTDSTTHDRYLNNGTYVSTQMKNSSLVTGNALEMLPVHRPTTFTIDPSIDPNKVSVNVTGPNGKPIPIQKSILRDLTYTITAEEVGEHIIQILLNGQHIKGSPFRSQAYNARAIQVDHIPNGVVNEPVEFEIDGSRAGSGNLEILVNGGHVTSFVKALGSQRFLASFVPHEAVTHLVEMTFNGEVVPGSSWRVTIMPAPKMSVIGDSVRLVPAGSPASFELSALGFSNSEIDVQILTPSKRHIPARIEEESGRSGEFRVEFTPTEVGSHLVEISIAGQKLPAGPLIAKVYNSSLIQVTDVPSAVVGHACQFRVDASAAGEGQLEISINEGEVPNHVQVVGGGRCLVSFTPEIAKPHYIDIKFNGEAVRGCPFICNVSDTSRVTLNLNHLELIPVDQPANFHMDVDGSGSAELAVSVRGPNIELPVKVTGDINNGFTAEFIPRDVGVHSISVEYNGHPVNGTPFLAKAFNADKVLIGPVARGSVGQPTHFTVDASQAGEGNLEITISARSQNIPTQVTPQGNARFSVSFVPFEACEHIINIAFNKRTVPDCPIITRVGGDSHVTVSGQALNSAGLGRQSYLTVSNVAGSLEDLEVNVEGPNGQAVPAQVTDNKDTTCIVAFTPRVVGEHRIAVNYRNIPVAGSPFSCKVYDVTAIKVKDAKRGVIGTSVTFLVETSQAGPGNLEVTVNGGRVPTSAQAQGPHTYAISFTPREPIVHTVDLRFNGEDVPGSPFSCQVIDTAKVLITDGLEKVSVNRVASFTIEADSSLGTPVVEVLSPTRESLLVHIKQSGYGSYTAGFTPKDVGDHSVEVKLDGSHVEGSPFLVKAYNADKVKVTDINSGVVGKPVFFSINASQAGAGNLEIIVAVNGKNVPNYVQSEGNAKFRVNFKPQEAAIHSLSVRFNGEPVPGSPFSCKVIGAGQAVITGNNLKMGAVKKLISFTVDPQAPSTNCDVIVTPPSNITLPITIEPIDGKYNVSFVPTEVGRHNISILVDGEPIKGSPFACNIYDVTKVHVSGLTEALLGQATTFTVDAAEAGEGTLELVVSTENNTVKAEVVACARGLYDVTFVPQTTSTHYVNISFNDDNVPGSPFKCPVTTNMLDGPSMIRVGNTAYMDLDMLGLQGPVSAEVTGPDGIIIPSTLTKLSSTLYRVEIRTRQVGTYSVMFSDGHKVISTQTLQAFDPNKVSVKEVADVVCHRPGTILVVASKEAGPGKLTVNVRAGGADVDSLIREGDNGVYEIIFHPTRAAPHKVHIKYNDVQISGSPLDVTVRSPTGGREVTATGLGLYQSCVSKVTSFTIETLGRPGKEFDVVISGPQGNAVPVRCYQHRDGNLLAEFTTNSIGTYKIDVLHGAKPVLGSPFFCQAFDASKVKLQELGPMTVTVHDHIALKLMKTEAGIADLDVTATSPLGQELPLQVTPLNDGAEMIEFSPSVPGTYMINITYGGCSIPGSPVACTVDAAGQARAKGEGLLSGHVGKSAHFIVTGTRSPPAVQVDGPDSVSKATVEAGVNPGTWNISYIPTEVGVFDIRVVSAGQQLPGSPWHPKIIDTRNLRVIGGWTAVCDDIGRLKLHPSNKISFDTAEAGPGELTGNIGDHPLIFEMTSSNRLKLVLPHLSSGEHRLEIFFNGVPFPGAPKLAYVQDLEPPVEDTSRVLLRGRGLTSAKCGEEVSFIIDGSQAGSGTPKVQLFSPTNELNVMLQHLGDSVYRASYIPQTPDPLLMTVSWNGRQLKGCPLQINVTSAADASRVICSGDGLRHGIVGQEIRSFIDTRRAGPGELTAHCVGQHKVAYCELYDHGDATFTLNVKPQEAGRHALTIKYAGEHVPGSPFTLRVSGAPDASKVRVYGPGIEHGVLATFQSRFICDTRGAGAGQLTVRVRGPKGAFRVEMQRETQKDRIILCRYDPTEPGDYRVEVRWAGVLVPGSPFPVKIVDTQDELLMLTQGGDTYSTGHHTITSWRGSQAIL